MFVTPSSLMQENMRLFRSIAEASYQRDPDTFLSHGDLSHYSFEVLDRVNFHEYPLLLIEYVGKDREKRNAISAKGLFGEKHLTTAKKVSQAATAFFYQMNFPASHKDELKSICVNWIERFGSIDLQSGHSAGGRLVIQIHHVLTSIGKNPLTVTFNSQLPENKGGIINLRTAGDGLTRSALGSEMAGKYHAYTVTEGYHPLSCFESIDHLTLEEAISDAVT